jgi:Zn-dependent M28 family amino/carboxypeptidase
MTMREVLAAMLAATLLMSACSKSDAPATAVTTTDFDADSAMSYARQQVAFGPRIPNTEAARKTGDWIVGKLKGTADTVLEQTWTHTTAKGEKLALRNIFARFRPNEKNRVLYLTHWDTRPVADSDPDPANRTKPFDGANDGASGVGLLLAIADALKKTPPGVGVDLLFVDGEDWGDFGPPDVDVLIGSEYFAAHLPSADYKPLYGVLFDMIGDQDLAIYQEGNSINAAPEVVQKVWGQAKQMGYESTFIPQAQNTITDDHVPLIKAGLRVIDVIDLDYGPKNASGVGVWHHAVADKMEHVSAKSLKIVGDVALALLR